MMGKDCERILSSFVKIENSLSNCIMKLAGLLNTPVIVVGDHGHSEGGSDQFEFKEKDSGIDISDIVDNVTEAIDSFIPDIEKMSTLESDLYTGTNEFNNSAGSPWTEIHTLEKSIKRIKTLSEPGKFVGGKSGMITLLTMALTETINAKWALIFYNDYIQRGFDAKVNSKLPSITQVGSDKKKTIGNIKQEFEENVNIPKESLDPY